MAFNIYEANSCKLLVVSVTRVDPSVTTANITVTNLNTQAATTTSITYNIGNGKATVHIPTSSFDSANGVFKICQTENSVEVACKAVIIHCDIDCCLVKLTNELIDCDCDCDRCSVALSKAQKIFLLLQSAKTTVDLVNSLGPRDRNSGYYTDILTKYLKAREICDNSCGCDC